MHRHRAAVRAEHAGPPHTLDERALETVQAKVTKTQLDLIRLTSERDAVALRLWLDERMSQAELAERLDRADRRAGGVGFSYAATQKLLWRRRQKAPA